MSGISHKNWMHNSFGRTGDEQALGGETSQSSGQKNYVRGLSFASSFSGPSHRVHALPSHLNASVKDLTEKQFKVPHNRPFGMSQSRLDIKKGSANSVEVDSASSVCSNGVGKTTTNYAIPPRFDSSLSKKSFGTSMNGFFVAPSEKLSSSFNKSSFHSSLARLDRFGSKSQEHSINSLMSVSNSSNGSLKGLLRISNESTGKFATSFNSSKRDLNASLRADTDKFASADAGCNGLNISVPSLSSFGQIKPDYLSLEAAKKKFQSSRH